MPNEKTSLNMLLSKLEMVDKKINDLSNKLSSIRGMIYEQCEIDEEQCPDVIESEKALVEAIEKLYVEDLLTREPEGDA